MYSLPIRVTLAALTIASAASTDPIRPRVSTSPSASLDMVWGRARRAEAPQARLPTDAPTGAGGGKAGTLTDCVRCGNYAKIRAHRFSLIVRPDLQRQLPMNLCLPRRSVPLGLPALAFVSSGGAACRKKETPAPSVATPTVTLSHDRAPLGSPVDVTYKFVVANDARFTEDYRVMVH